MFSLSDLLSILILGVIAFGAMAWWFLWFDD